MLAHSKKVAKASLVIFLLAAAKEDKGALIDGEVAYLFVVIRFVFHDVSHRVVLLTSLAPSQSLPTLL